MALTELGFRKAASRWRIVRIVVGTSLKSPKLASSDSSTLYPASFSWMSMSGICFILSTGWTSTDAGIEDSEERLEALDFSCSSSSSISRPKTSLVECRAEDEDELYS